MPKPDRHFSDLPSALDVQAHDGVLRVEGAGFVTRPMAEAALSPFVAPGERASDAQTRVPPRILVDLRNVSGYEAACVAVAQGWLSRASTLGVERIAFVANSSVVRTAAEVVARHVRAPLHTFSAVEAAGAWLDTHDSAVPTATAAATSTAAARPQA